MKIVSKAIFTQEGVIRNESSNEMTSDHLLVINVEFNIQYHSHLTFAFDNKFNSSKN